MKIIVKSGQILHEGKIYYTGEDLEVMDDTAKLLIAGDLAETEEEAETPEKALKDMTVKELTAYAAERNIPIDAGTKKKADLIAAIRAAEDGQDGGAAGGDNSGAENPPDGGPVTGMPEE